MKITRKGFEIKDFALGLRFLTGEDGFTPADAWELLFHTLPAEMMTGAELSGLQEETPEGPCYMCVMNNLPLKRFRLLWPAIAARPAIGARLLFYRPVWQSNRLERYEAAYEFLGSVSPDGSVENGDAAYGAMRFCGAAIEGKKEVPAVLIAPDGYCGVLSPARSARVLMQAAEGKLPGVQVVPFPLADGDRGTVDTIVRAQNGRYVKTEQTAEDGSVTELVYAVLPDRSVAFESDSRENTDRILKETLALGFRSFVIGLYGEAVPADSELMKSLPYPGAEEATVRLIEAGMEPDELLDLTAFNGKAKAALAVITGDGRREPAGPTQAVLSRCKALRVPVFTPDAPAACPVTAEEAEALLCASADKLFSVVRADRRFHVK